MKLKLCTICLFAAFFYTPVISNKSISNHGASFLKHIATQPPDITTDSLNASNNTLSSQTNNPEDPPTDPGEPLDIDNMMPEKIKQICELVNKNKLLSNLDPTKPQTVPMGIGKNIGGRPYTIAITGMEFTPEGCDVQAMMSIPEPFSENTIEFAGKVSINPTGFNNAGELLLANNKKITIWKDKADLYFRKGSYVSFDCNGYKGFGLFGEVHFDEKFVAPATGLGKNCTSIVKPGANNVLACFETEAEGLGFNDLLIDVSIDPFVINKGVLKDFVFAAKNAVFDFSESGNSFDPENGQVDDYLSSINMSGDVSNTWQGFYLEQLDILLPEKFTQKEDSRASLGISDLIIDSRGVTGLFTGEDVITFNNGSMEGWKYSLDYFDLKLDKSTIDYVNFKGQIRLPIESKEKNTGINYNVSIDNQQYFMSCLLDDDFNIEVNALKANMLIEKGSLLEVTATEKTFSPEATLNGKISFKGDNILPVHLEDIEFQGLTIKNTPQYIECDHFVASLDIEKPKVNNFPITISDFKLEGYGEGIFGAELGLKLNLTSKISVGGNLFAKGKADVDIPSHKYEFNPYKFGISRLEVDYISNPFCIKGFIEKFDGDDTYGKGFAGGIDLTVLENIEINTRGMFGSKDDYRYFFIDGKAVTSEGEIPVFTPFISFYGFAGGISYHMDRQEPEEVDLESENDEGQNNKIGVGISGNIYTPDNKMGLGLSAGVIYGSSGDPTAYNGTAGFAMQFNTNWGLDYVSVDGDVRFMQPIESLGKGPLYAEAEIKYDFPIKEFTAEFNVAIDMPMLSGSSYCDILANPEEWHVYMGTPKDPCFLSLGFGSFSVNSENYFMIGDPIPPMKPVPSHILNPGSKGDDDYNELGGYTADRSETEMTAGFAFGSSMGVGPLSKDFLCFYGSLEAEAGFDIGLYNYSDYVCAHNSSTPGINGWYAFGQLYAGIDADLGLKAKLFGKDRKFEILSLYAGIVCEARAPNPIWFHTDVHGRYSVLNGMISGNCNFEAEVGKKCDLVSKDGEKALPFKIIAEATPGDGVEGVDVFTMPQVAFNIPVDKEFKFMLDGKQQTFKTRLASFSLGYNGISLDGEKKWNHDKSVLAYKTFEPFPSEEKINFNTMVECMEYKDNTWSVMDDYEKESVNHTFTSGVRPDYIPTDRVKYSYPLNGMLNFYKNQASAGYLVCENNFNYLFENMDESTQLLGYFEDAGENRASEPFTYTHSIENKVSRLDFTMATDNLVNGSNYRMVLTKSIPAATEVDDNVNEVEKRILEKGETNADIKSKEIEGNISMFSEARIHNLIFRVSNYNTFEEKFDQQKISGFLISDEHVLEKIYEKKYLSNEYFDSYEIDGGENFNALVQFRADLEDIWMTDYFLPNIYDKIPIAGIVDLSEMERNPQLEIPPVNAIYIYQSSVGLLNDISDRYIKSGDCSWHYETNYYIEKDYYYLLRKCCNTFIEHGEIEEFKEYEYTSYSKVKSPINTYIYYYLPGQLIPIYSKRFSFKYD